MIFDLFETDIFRENMKMAKAGLAGYSVWAIGVFLGMGILGYLLIKIFIPEAIISSWWRSGSKTYSLTGMKFDWHMLGLVYDITGPNNKVSDAMFKKARAIFPVVISENGNNIVPVSQADHLHVGWINKRMGVQTG
jgi:hypothetical protein